MARQDLNELFARTSFLHGANAAYIEDLYAKYQDNPASVGEQWRAFFADLKDAPEAVRAEATGPSWKSAGWPVQANGELVAALDGDWVPVEQRIAIRHARFRARTDDDPLLPRARPSGGESGSAGP
jgi:2-oxoglutarate dehydrogenase E1 component